MHFFCQAEDGIRCRNVTGVQTCALPILTSDTCAPNTPRYECSSSTTTTLRFASRLRQRSEERRVGKECRSRCKQSRERKRASWRRHQRSKYLRRHSVSTRERLNPYRRVA